MNALGGGGQAAEAEAEAQGKAVLSCCRLPACLPAAPVGVRSLSLSPPPLPCLEALGGPELSDPCTHELYLLLILSP